MTFRVVLFAVPLAACGPAGVAGPQAAELSEPITNGSVDSSDTAAVALIDPAGDTECSGTVVAPTIVITAAHCLAGSGIDHVAMGVDSFAPTGTVPVVASYAHPDFDLESLSDDIAVLRLGAPVTDVPFATVALTATSSVGDMVQAVGYGLPGTGLVLAAATRGDAGFQANRHSGTARVSAVAATTFTMTPAPSQPCSGDSGGPIFQDFAGGRQLIGVTSYGDPQCASEAVATRVDAFASFLEPFLREPTDPGPSCSLGRAPSRSTNAWALPFGMSTGLLIYLIRSRETSPQRQQNTG